MASITTRSNGSRFISFRNAAGEPRHITLGKVAKRYAEAVKVKVEDLVSSNLHGHAPSDETARWVASLDERLHEKLAAVDLLPRRQSTTIGEWLEQYLEDRRGDLKQESLRKLEQTKTKLLAYIDTETPLRQLTVDDAAGWRRFLRNVGLSEAAVKTHCGNAKTMIAAAVRRKLINESPFSDLKSGATPSRYNRYVKSEEIARVIDACPYAEWKVLFGLARFAGLRVPSETHLLTWADVDFERCRMTVRSPKTEHHEGHEQRIVPIVPKLMALIQERFDTCPEGEQRLVTIGGQGSSMTRPARRIIKRASVEPWKRLWQTLRQSCEKEWAMTMPQYAVSKWIGHSITVSGRHYANDVPDELFERAAGIEGDGANSAQQNAQQKAHETSGNGVKRQPAADEVSGRNSRDFQSLRDSSTDSQSGEKWSRGDSNPRADTVSKSLLHV